MKEISVEELQELREQKKEFVLLDVREPDEYAAYNLGGQLIPLGSLPNRLGEIEKNKPIVVHCKSGGRSARAMQFLTQSGFADVSNLVGGVTAWIERIAPNLQK